MHNLANPWTYWTCLQSMGKSWLRKAQLVQPSVCCDGFLTVALMAFPLQSTFCPLCILVPLWLYVCPVPLVQNHMQVAGRSKRNQLDIQRRIHNPPHPSYYEATVLVDRHHLGDTSALVRASAVLRGQHSTVSSRYFPIPSLTGQSKKELNTIPYFI